MLHVLPNGNNFAWSVTNATARPASGYGTAVSIGTNSKAQYGYTQLLSALARDVYAVMININSIASSGTASDTVIDIAVDPAGGTSYSIVIADLLGSCADTYVATGGIWYYFPLFIKAGSTVAARGSQVGGGELSRIFFTGYGSPKDRRLLRCGTKVTTYGISGSSGTAVTSGSTSEGSFVALSGAVTTRTWWWQVGMGCNNAAMAGGGYHADLVYGDGTNNVTLVENRLFVTSVAEAISAPPHLGLCNRDLPTGGTLYGRLQCNTTPSTGLSMAAYGVSG
jgi:hypothetical protein